MSNIIQGDQKVERNSFSRSVSLDVAEVTMSAIPLTLDLSFKSNLYFVGTTEQEVYLGDATQYSIGHTFYLVNDSEEFDIVIKDEGSNVLIVVKPFQRAVFILRDNTTTSGLWIISKYTKTGASTNISPMFGAGGTGVSTKGSFLSDKNIPTNRTGIPIVTDGKLDRIAVGVQSSGDFKFGLYKHPSPFSLLVTVRITPSDGLYKTFSLDGSDGNVSITALDLLANDAVAVKIETDSVQNPSSPKINFSVVGV